MDRNEISADNSSDESSSDDDNIVDESLRNDDREDDEKLSEVIEEPEEQMEIKIAVFHRDENTKYTMIEEEEEYSDDVKILRERILNLNIVILSLRNELCLELSLWQKEREEYKILQEKTDLNAIEEATAAARAAAEAYAAESPLSDDLKTVRYNCCNEILDANPEQTLSELTILEYEKKLAKYQDALAFSQAEKRYNMRRQLAANTYRKNLIEVERLCDEELEKIKENANSLKPLEKMISQWTYNSDDGRCGGDAEKSLDNSYKSYGNNSDFENGYSRSSESRNALQNNDIRIEVDMAPEIFSAKFNVDQTRDVSSRNNNNLLQSGSNDWLIANNYERNNISQSTNPFGTLKWESSNYNALSTIL